MTGSTQAAVTTIPIPTTAAPGYYNLTTSDTSNGNVWSGGFIIEITR